MRAELAFTAKLKRGAAERAETKSKRAEFETVQEREAALAKFPPVRQFEWCASPRLRAHGYTILFADAGERLQVYCVPPGGLTRP